MTVKDLPADQRPDISEDDVESSRAPLLDHLKELHQVLDESQQKAQSHQLLQLLAQVSARSVNYPVIYLRPLQEAGKSE